MKTFDRVVDLLKQDEKYRDSDLFLTVRFLYDECRALGVDPEKITALTFLTMMRNGKFTSFSNVERLRRKAQELNPSLRGRLWKQRHEQEEAVVKELKSIQTELL